MMRSANTTVFKSNQTQAIWLPKAVAFPESIKKVEIATLGNIRVINPVGESRDYRFDGPAVSDDFLGDREQALILWSTR